MHVCVYSVFVCACMYACMTVSHGQQSSISQLDIICLCLGKVESVGPEAMPMVRSPFHSVSVDRNTEVFCH